VKIPKIYSADIIDWHETTEKYRSRIDLATVVWFWLKLERPSGYKLIVKQILNLMKNEIYDDLLNIDTQNLIIRTNFEKCTLDTPFCGGKENFNPNEKWLLEYRAKLKHVTPFSEFNYYEECDFSDISSDDSEYFEYIEHPILSNKSLTHRFIDIDRLIHKLDAKKYKYPVELRRHTKLEKIVSADISTPFKIELDENEPFVVLRLAEQIYYFLTQYSEGIKLIEDENYQEIKKEILLKLQATGNEAFTITTVNHIWRIIVPAHKRGKGKKNVFENLPQLVSFLWGEKNDESEIDTVWRRENTKDREKRLINIGFNSSEAKSILNSLSPILFHSKAQPSKKVLLDYCVKIKLFNLEWTSGKYVFNI